VNAFLNLFKRLGFARATSYSALLAWLA